MLPELPPLPALTRAEGELVDRYLEVLGLLGRVNPSRCDRTLGALHAAQALVSGATALRNVVALMHERGESEFHTATLTRALRVLEAERLVARLELPPR